jgi:hypothetical protein
VLEQNPYEPPQTIESKLENDSPGDNPWKVYLQWTLAFGFNLILPLYLGQKVTKSAGQVGMYAGVLAIYGVGLGLCAKTPWLARMLSLGGFAVGFTQAFPILQSISGVIAIGTVGYGRIVLGSTANSPFDLDTIMTGFTAVLITGGLLALVSLGVGRIILLALNARIDRREAEEYATSQTTRDS